MASLAPHVSRVSKDYAPHGWSYMNEYSVNWTAQITAPINIPLIHAEDSDYYIESVSLCAQTVATTTSGNRFVFALSQYDNAGAAISPAVGLQASLPSPTSLTALAWTDLLVNQNELLTDGRVLVLVITDGAGTAADISNVTVKIRYRRKA